MALGLLISLAEASTAIKGLLNWWGPVGPLSGKTGVAVLAWLASWGVLAHRWRNPYADCNASSSLTIADFGCFQTAFAAGCP